MADLTLQYSRASLLLAVLLASACEGNDGLLTEHISSAASDSTSGSASGSASDTGAPTTGDGESGATDASTGSTEEPWVVDQCLTRFTWDCGAESCDPPQAVPFHACEGTMLCAPIAVGPEDGEDSPLVYEKVDTEEAAKCALQALRDRKPGQIRITWGDPQGWAGDFAIFVAATVTIVGDETVLMDWAWQYNDNFIDEAAVSRRVLLQPAAFFDDCLAMPDTAKLIACLTAGSSVGEPAPVGWLPPWTVGTCDDELAPTCPGT
jgi:hypothetical protein